MSIKEEQLYPEIEEWLKKYLEDRYCRYQVTTTHNTSRIFLDSYLNGIGIEINEAIGLAIKVDIVGVLKKGKEIKLVFVEVKDQALNLKDLGQLWGYTQLVNPIESFLISSKGLGTLEKVFKILKREDLLRYGSKKEKMMRVCGWDSRKKAIDYASLLPKL